MATQAEAADRRPARLTDRLRQAITDSRLAYRALAKLAGVRQPMLSRFMSGERDITLVAAACLCQVLGLELVQAAPVLTEPLDDPELSTRKRRAEGSPPPPFTGGRGQGRRFDRPVVRDAVPASEAAAAPAEPPPRRASRGRKAAAASPAVEAKVARPATQDGDAKPAGRKRKKKGE